MGRMPKVGTAPPAFFKIMIGDFLKEVCLPRAFIKNFNGNIPKKVTLTSSNGKLWSASVKKRGKDWFLCKKWSTFARDHALAYGEFLVFKLNAPAVFRVSIYKKNALEKVIPSTGEAVVESNFHSEEKKQGKETPKISERHPDQMLHEIKKGESTSTEKINSTPLRPVTTNVRKAISIFTITLGRSAKYQVALPRKFAREKGFTEKESIILVDQCGVSWPVKLLQTKTGTTILCSGWNEFCKRKNLRTRDTCEFEYEEGMGNAVRVTIVPAVESNSISPKGVEVRNV